MASSPQTFMCTSILLLNARVTLASICTTLPSLIGFSKDILSTDAVTTGAPAMFHGLPVPLQYPSSTWASHPSGYQKYWCHWGNTSSGHYHEGISCFLIHLFFYKDTLRHPLYKMNLVTQPVTPPGSVHSGILLPPKPWSIFSPGKWLLQMMQIFGAGVLSS